MTEATRYDVTLEKSPPVRAVGDSPDSRAPLLLLALAVILLISTLFYAFVLSLTSIRMARSSAGLIHTSEVWSRLAALPWPIPSDGASLAIALLVIGVVTMGTYALAIVLCWGRPATREAVAAVLVPAGIFLTVSAFALPTQSGDIIDYVLSGRVAAVYGQSPYEVAPDAFPNDPLLPYASGNYTHDPEQKPPVWIAGAVGAAALTAELSPADAILVTRLLFLVLTIVNVGLIATILRRWRPHHLLAGLVIYSWSPIIILHGQSRFDTLMASFALLAALLLVTGKHAGAMAALTMSILVKLLTLPLLAVSVLGDLIARRWRRLVATGAIVAGVTLFLYLPFEGGAFRVLEHLGLTERAGSSLPGAISMLLVAVAGVLVLWAGLRSRGEIEGTLQGWALASIAVIPLSPIGWAWYLVTPIAIVSLSGERWRTAILVGLSGVAFLADTWIRSTNQTYPLPVPFGLSRTEAILVGQGMLIIVAMIVVAAHARYRGRGSPLAAAGESGDGARTG